MKALALLCGATLAWAGFGRAQDPVDRLDDALAFSTLHDSVRLRLSGLIDAEGYYFEHPAPGFIEASDHSLFNPRLTLFLDAQLGPYLYFFGQARVDRGFDPSDQGAQVRLVEDALRFTPWQDGRLNLQVGKSATVFGTWVKRHLSWENPFVTAPLAYDNGTLVFGKGARSPVPGFGAPAPNTEQEFLVAIWRPDYSTGLTVSGQTGHFDYAAELKNTALSSPPEFWSATEVGFDHPSFNARLGYRPSLAWNIGISAGDGTEPQTGGISPAGHGPGNRREMTVGQDVSYAAGHWEFWSEAIENRFEIPGLANLNAFSYYVEARYKLTPQLFGALRWNQQFFSRSDRAVFPSNVRRIDAAVTYRCTAHLQLKLQYLFQAGGDLHGEGSTVATQITVRF